MLSSLSSLAGNLTEGLYNKKSRKCKSCLVLYISIEDNKLICKYRDCNKSHKLHFKKHLIKRFKFCDAGIHNFFCYLQKEFIHMNT